MSSAEELERLVALRDRGVLSEEEFQAEKARLLGHSSVEGPSEAPSPTEPISTQPSSSEDQTSPGLVASSSGPAVTPIPSPDPTGGSDRRQQRRVFVLTGKHVLIGLLILVMIAAGADWASLSQGATRQRERKRGISATEQYARPESLHAQCWKKSSGYAPRQSALTPSSGTNLASYTGNSIGLYGGTLDTSSCNPSQMVTTWRPIPQRPQRGPQPRESQSAKSRPTSMA